MVGNYFWDIGINYMYTMIISKFPKDGPKNYHGFTFEADPKWVASKPVKAIDDETNEVFVKNSVGEMGKIIFGDMDSYSSRKISELIKSGEKYRGLRFEHVPNDYVDCVPSDDTQKRAVTGTNLRTGNVTKFSSLTDSARHIKMTQPSETEIKLVGHNIRNCASRYLGQSNKVYGHRWEFTE